MSLRSLLTTAIFAFLAIHQAAADCQLKNVLDPDNLPDAPSELCKSQSNGDYTFSMDISEVSVPTFNGEAALDGIAGSTAFAIYDEDCNPKGLYSPDQDGDCGAPYVIEENFLKYVLTVTSVNFGVGSPKFVFSYANGKFSTGNDGCGCDDIGSGLRVEIGCKCPFPVEGLPDKKRSVGVSFKA